MKHMDGSVEDIPFTAGDRFAREFAYFLECWRGNAQLRVTVRDGLAANQVLDAAYASAADQTHSNQRMRKTERLLDAYTQSIKESLSP